jgi:N-acetylmuramoyl-L-alanine amidase
MNFHATSVTPDMTSYHAFDEISEETTAAIIETGFLNLDRQMLTKDRDKVVKGITDGILCFVRNEDIVPQATQATQATP